MPGLYLAFVRNEEDTCRVTQVIPTIPDDGNHTTGFQEAACSVASHDTCLEVPKVLAAVGMQVLLMERFLQKVGITRPSRNLVFDCVLQVKKYSRKIRNRNYYSYSYVVNRNSISEYHASDAVPELTPVPVSFVTSPASVMEGESTCP